MTTGYVWEEIYGWHNTGNSAGAAPAGLNAQPFEHFESADSNGIASQILLLERGVISQRVAATNKSELEMLRKRLTV